MLEAKVQPANFYIFTKMRNSLSGIEIHGNLVTACGGNMFSFCDKWKEVQRISRNWPFFECSQWGEHEICKNDNSGRQPCHLIIHHVRFARRYTVYRILTLIRSRKLSRKMIKTYDMFGTQKSKESVVLNQFFGRKSAFQKISSELTSYKTNIQIKNSSFLSFFI